MNSNTFTYVAVRGHKCLIKDSAAVRIWIVVEEPCFYRKKIEETNHVIESNIKFIVAEML